MNCVFRCGARSRSIMLTALVAALGAGCGSTPTAAPVLERSPNAPRTVPAAPQAAPPARAAPVATAPVATAPVETAPVATAPVTRQAPTVATAQTAGAPQPAAPPIVVAPAATSEPKVETPAAAIIDEPITKPYRQGDWRPEFHVVKKGDTLYSISLDYGQDYRELAAWNNLEDPALIRLDQRLRLFPPDSVGELALPQAVPLPAEIPPAPVVVPVKSEPKARKLPYSERALAQLKGAAPKAAAAAPPAAAPSPPPPAPVNPAVTAQTPPAPKEAGNSDARLIWEWPTQGKVIYAFGEGTNQKGVGIEGRPGQAVLASAPGRVVYSGSGLRGYGKLIIVKHNTSYLSVYAHNSQILVKEGQAVAKGQKIAEMGNTDSDRVALHFEIRRLGKPIDPLQYLPARNS